MRGSGRIVDIENGADWGDRARWWIWETIRTGLVRYARPRARYNRRLFRSPHSLWPLRAQRIVPGKLTRQPLPSTIGTRFYLCLCRPVETEIECTNRP